MKKCGILAGAAFLALFLACKQAWTPLALPDVPEENEKPDETGLDDSWDPWETGGEEPGGEELSAGEEPVERPPSGFLLSVIVPPGLVLTNESFVRISTGGLEAAEDDTRSFPVTESFQDKLILLSPGRYTLEVLLVERNRGFYWPREELEITGIDRIENRPALKIEPERDAFMTQADYDKQTPYISFRATTENSAGLTTVNTGGSGISRTREMKTGPGVNTVYFVVFRGEAQVITVSGPDASRVSTVSSTVEGESPGATTKPGQMKDLYVVDTSAIAAGGEMKFTLNVREPDKQPLTYALTLSLPSLLSLRIQPETLNAQGTFSKEQFFFLNKPISPGSPLTTPASM